MWGPRGSIWERLVASNAKTRGGAAAVRQVPLTWPVAEGSLPTRDAALRRLAELIPKAPLYARERHWVEPPHERVSGLSPYLRHRLLLESEVVAALWSAHAPAVVDKLVSEVLWRTYWKGWLELRPQVWGHYLDQWRRDRDALTGTVADRYERALEGRTGIACFDAWVAELVESGYLHNHARMWFASIWIFTLGLPWTLGAAFFLRHLLDGDPASNTLSWRWVGGLHTRGKHYLARAENIARYTNGRFDPRGQLQEEASPLSEVGLDLDPRPLPQRPTPDPGQCWGLLVTNEDLLPEDAFPARLRPLGVAGGWDASVEADLELAAPVASFAKGSLDDALARAERHFGVPVQGLEATTWLAAAEDWALSLGLRQVLTLEAPIGPWAERLDRLAARLAPQGVRLIRVRRDWDSRLWPGATQGYFRFRQHAQAKGRLGDLVPGPRSEGGSGAGEGRQS